MSSLRSATNSALSLSLSPTLLDLTLETVTSLHTSIHMNTSVRTISLFTRLVWNIIHWSLFCILYNLPEITSIVQLMFDIFICPLPPFLSFSLSLEESSISYKFVQSISESSGMTCFCSSATLSLSTCSFSKSMERRNSDENLSEISSPSSGFEMEMSSRKLKDCNASSSLLDHR